MPTEFSGVMWPPIDLLTEDGYDLQWGVSVLGHWYFTELLIPALVAGAQSSSDHHARVLTISSSAALVHTLDWDTFKDGPKRRKTMSIMLYNQSKFVSARLDYMKMTVNTCTATGQRRCRTSGRKAVRRKGHRLLPD